MKDRELVRLYWPVEVRPAFDALFDLDDAMGDVVMLATQPALAAIKLAWWRERLEGLDEGQVPAEPRLAAAARELLPRAITGAQMAKLETGWGALLMAEPDYDSALDRGETLFALAARLLQPQVPAEVISAGRAYARGNLVRRGLIERGPDGEQGAAIPPQFRSLTGLATLASRDLRRREPQGTPARALALFKHRLTGRI